MSEHNRFKVKRTTPKDRLLARGEFIVCVTDAGAQKIASREGRYVAAVYGDRAVPCKLVVIDLSRGQESLADDECGMDRNVRERIGVEEDDDVELVPLQGRLHRFPWVQPRTLLLEYARPYYPYAEKNLCLLHPNSAMQLGIEEGEYVRLSSVLRKDDGAYSLEHTSLRVLTHGKQRPLDVWGRELEPIEVLESTVCLDGDAREKLKLRQSDGYPVAVQTDVLALFLSRILYYAIASIALVFTMGGFLRGVIEFTRWSDWLLVGTLSGVTLALLVTIIFLDLRARVQY